jgi:N-acetylglucosaminyldiphosphoundecaprenol N-acetyl-beta-D-mannosaminyltransferase
MNTQKNEGIDYNLFTGLLNDLPLSKKTVINTINQYSFCIAEEDEAFKNALKESEILLPDGEGIVLAERILTGKKIRKISGTDLHFHFLSSLNSKKGKCFYLGSSPSTLNKIKAKLHEEYPDIRAEFYSPPFKENFSDEDNWNMINAINAFEPDVLFIGLTAPKQEKWSIAHKQAINAKIICSIGAVFDFYAGTVQRPSQLWIDMRLEWLGRFMSEPKRMWRRYFYFGPIYMYMIIKRKFKTRKPVEAAISPRQVINEFRERSA